MTELSPAQTRLLALAKSSDGGMLASDCSRRVSSVLMKHGFLILDEQSADGGRLLLTEAGLAVLDPPKPAAAQPPRGPSKVQRLIELMSRPGGAMIADMMDATGWQAHSVRGAIAGAVKKHLGISVVSENVENRRVYRILAEPAA